MDLRHRSLDPADRGRLIPPGLTPSSPPPSCPEIRRLIERDLLEEMRRSRFPNARGWICPRCYSTRTIRWGRSNSRQRYRCKDCRRTFNDLTGTHLAGTKYLHLWPAFAWCMALALPVREVSARLGINKDTALRWRHRLSEAYERRYRGPIRDSAVAISAHLQRTSEKGLRPQNRAPRRVSRYPFRGLLSDREHVVLVFLSDRTEGAGGYTAIRLNAGRPSSFHWELLLDPLLTGKSDLITRTGKHSSLCTYARRLGHRVIDPTRKSEVPLTPGREGAEPPVQREVAQKMLRRAQSHRASWRRWIPRFHGIATRYLRHYLAWHRRLVTLTRESLDPHTAGVGTESPNRLGRLASEILKPVFVPPGPCWTPRAPPTKHPLLPGANLSLGHRARVSGRGVTPEEGWDLHMLLEPERAADAPTSPSVGPPPPAGRTWPNPPRVFGFGRWESGPEHPSPSSEPTPRRQDGDGP